MHKYRDDDSQSMPVGWQVKPPKNNTVYFARMTRALFTAGLNWKMIEQKWPQFRRAFADFAPTRVARFSEEDVRELLKDASIVRNERKIRATVHNAGTFLALAKEFGSFRNYLHSFNKDEKGLQIDLQRRFQHLGASTARMFLWSVGYPLTPTREEKAWMAGHR